MRHLTYIVIECSCSNKQDFGTNALGCFGSKIAHLQGVLERTWRFLRKREHEVGIDIGEFDQRDIAHQSKRTLKEEDKSIRTYHKNGINGKVDIVVILYILYTTRHQKRCGGINHTIHKEGEESRLCQLGTLRHIAQTNHSHDTRNDL